MHRLAKLQQHIVGDVYHGIDRTDAATTQFFTHPQRAWRLDVDTFHHAPQIAWARLRRVNADRQRGVDGGGHRAHVRLGQRNLVKYAHVARDADDAQAVGAVRRDADLDGVVVQFQVVTDVGADRRIQRQLDDAVMIVGNAQLGERAQHAFRRLAAQLGGLDFEVARQHRAHGGDRHFQAGTAVWRAADDVEQAIAAYVNLGDAQFVGVRVLTALDHLAHDDAVKRAGNRIHAVHFQAGHGDLIG